MPRKNILLTVLVLAFVAVACAASAWFWFLAPAPPPRSVVLISIDTCRADRLGCYGHPGGTTPVIDALAGEGTLFTHVVSPVPVTLPAHTSMLTGTQPVFHGVRDNFNFRVRQDDLTLAEIFQSHGFTTGAVIGAFPLESHTGIDQGFQTYRDMGATRQLSGEEAERTCEEATRMAIDWLGEHGADPFFFFLHFYDPHAPYEPPEPFATRFADDPYAGEVAWSDHCVGLFVEALKTKGLFDSTMIVVTSDHGEMLGEHGEDDHSFFIYESAIRVPLVIRMPGGSEARRVEDPVGLVDLVPTIASIMGFDLPGPVHGVDLSPWLRGASPEEGDRYLYAESLIPTQYGGNSLLGVTDDRFKYIQTTRPELYDLVEDPGETRNLHPEQPGRAARLQGRLKEILAASEREVSDDQQATPSRETVQMLQSLGYVGGKVSGEIEFDSKRDDPKELIEFHRIYQKAAELSQRGASPERVIEMLEGLLLERPTFWRGYGALAQVLAQTGRFEEAMLQHDRAVEAVPDEPTVWFARAQQRAMRRDWAGAGADLDQVLRLEPDNVQAHARRSEVRLQLRDLEGALEDLTAAMHLEPGNAEYTCQRGRVRAMAGDTPGAVADFRACRDALPAGSPLRARAEQFLRQAGAN